MTNLASVLKSEVTRLARKELRAETESLKKVVAAQRADIAALKRRTSELEKAVKALARASAKTTRSSEPEQEDADAGQFRFRAQGMASIRRRLGLSAEDFGLLVGASVHRCIGAVGLPLGERKDEAPAHEPRRHCRAKRHRQARGRRSTRSVEADCVILVSPVIVGARG